MVSSIIAAVFLLIFYRTDNNPKPIENIDSNQRSYFDLLKNPIILQAIVSAAFAYSALAVRSPFNLSP